MARKRQKQNRPTLARYPSIDGPHVDVIDKPCLAFHKYDGSNLQFKWTQKDGWCQAGTRKRTIDADNRLFGAAIEIFNSNFADGILSSLRRYKEHRNAKSLIAFCEFFGEHTFSGLHRDREKRHLKLFDVWIPEHGFVLPHDFRSHFGQLEIAEVIYDGPLSNDFMTDVYQGKYGVKEGVVAKGITTTQRRKGKMEQSTWMVKVKTKLWLEELQRRAGESPILKQELADNLNQQASLVHSQPVDSI